MSEYYVAVTDTEESVTASPDHKWLVRVLMSVGVGIAMAVCVLYIQQFEQAELEPQPWYQTQSQEVEGGDR